MPICLVVFASEICEKNHNNSDLDRMQLTQEVVFIGTRYARPYPNKPQCPISGTREVGHYGRFRQGRSWPIPFAPFASPTVAFCSAISNRAANSGIASQLPT